MNVRTGLNVVRLMLVTKTNQIDNDGAQRFGYRASRRGEWLCASPRREAGPSAVLKRRPIVDRLKVYYTIYFKKRRKHVFHNDGDDREHAFVAGVGNQVV